MQDITDEGGPSAKRQRPASKTSIGSRTSLRSVPEDAALETPRMVTAGTQTQPLSSSAAAEALHGAVSMASPQAEEHDMDITPVAEPTAQANVETTDADLEQGGQLARTGPQSSWLVRGAQAAAKQTDIVKMFQPTNDREFRALIESGQGRSFSSPALRQCFTDTEQCIRDLHLPADVTKRLMRDLQEARSDLASLTNDRSRMDLVVLVASRMVLTPLPVLLPLLANPKQYDGAALIIASYVKTTLMAVNLAMTPTADSKATKDLFWNRDFINNFHALTLMANLIPTDRAKAVAEGIPYNVCAAIAGFSALMLVFFGSDALMNFKNNKTHGDATSTRLTEVGEGLPPATKASLSQMNRQLTTHRSDLQSEAADFKDRGLRLSRTASRQVSDIQLRIGNLQKDLIKLIGVEGNTPRPANRDLVAKSALSLVSAAVLVAPFVPVTGAGLKEKVETIPAVDLSSDFAAAIVLIIKKTLDPTQSIQELQEAFSQWCSFSGPLSYTFGANAAAGYPVSKGGRDFAVFTAGLTTANLTVANLTGDALAVPINAFFELFKIGDAEGARGQLQAIREQMQRDPAAAPTLGDASGANVEPRITELPE
jgi:hypothetical protein